ncbi:MAG: hypothetical protein HQ567_05305 [Candidatus Nealsonbacteria bacterium]|nr:hypothetical protein [Candidatus Nealsonbacteria bacterium]
MVIQLPGSSPYQFEGKELPDSIGTFAGVGTKGKHMATLLLPERALRSIHNQRQRSNQWPSRRDVVHMVVGVVLLVIVRTGLILAANTF